MLKSILSSSCWCETLFYLHKQSVGRVNASQVLDFKLLFSLRGGGLERGEVGLGFSFIVADVVVVFPG